MNDETLTVSQVLDAVDVAVASSLPGPIWVRGEVTGFRRTSGGAVFFRLVDAAVDDAALEVACRGRVMREVDRVLETAGLGALRDGIELRIRGTVGVARRQSLLRLSLLEIDPTFTAGRLAVDRAAVLSRMAADGSLTANARLELPLVPIRVGLVTSRGSAAHADFLDQLRRSGFRFSVKTAHTIVQGEDAPDSIVAAVSRVCREPVDVLVLIRGGGSKLDLAVFDTQAVGQAVASAPVPVVTGIGHEIDRTVADEAAAISQKTPTAAGEWLVSRVKAFADRLNTARLVIRREAQSSLATADQQLKASAAVLAGARGTLARQSDLLQHERRGVADSARRALSGQHDRLESLSEFFSAIGVEPTLRRGFALVTSEGGDTVIRSVGQVTTGDRLQLRLSDGTVPVTVEKT